MSSHPHIIIPHNAVEINITFDLIRTDNRLAVANIGTILIIEPIIGATHYW